MSECRISVRSAVWLCWTFWVALPTVTGSLLRHQGTTKGDEHKGSPSLSTFLPECVFINLWHRTDRLQALEVDLQLADLRCSRVEAHDGLLDGCNFQEACRRSHWDALTQIEKSGAPYGLVLEDDATWLESVETTKYVLQHVAEDIKKHPVILLACNTEGLVTDSDQPWLWNVVDCFSTSAYIVRRDYIPMLKRTWGQPITEYMGAIDRTWQKLQIPDHWALTRPKLIRQRPSFSDIEHVNVNYGHFAAGYPGPGNTSRNWTGAAAKGLVSNLTKASHLVA